MDKTISIIITSYNYERFAAETLDSALSQTYPHVEVICVDDGSTDRSRDIIATYSDHVKVIFQENAGQGSAINTGFNACKGDIIIFVDSDDLLYPACAEMVAANWKDNYSIIHYDMSFIDQSGGRSSIPEKNHINSKWAVGDVLKEILEEGGVKHPPTSANAFGRRYLSRVMPMPIEKWWINPDVYLCILGGFYGENGAIDTKLCAHRIHQSAGGLVKDGRLIPPKWKRELIYRIEIDREIRSRAASLGYKVSARPLLKRHFFLKDYLIWRRIDQETPDGELDGLLGLRRDQIFLLLLKCVQQSDLLSLPKKLVYFIWSLLFFLLSIRSAELLVRISDARLRYRSA